MKYASSRSDYIFKNRPVIFQDWNGEGFKVSIPCIVLCHRKTDVAIAYPGFERWYLSWVETTARDTETYRKKARAIVAFLNYILWNSPVFHLQHVTLMDIVGFLKDHRVTNPKGKRKPPSARDPVEWRRDIITVYSFLVSFHKYNHTRLHFSYDPVDLFREGTSIQYKWGRMTRKDTLKCNYLGVSRPSKTHRKQRFLPEGFLDIILMVAQAYDPMLVLPIAFQSFAGLREGEVVNLTRSSITIKYGGFGLIGKIILDITEPAPFALSYKGNCDFGSIKVRRMQEIYPLFNRRVMDMLAAHNALLDKLGEANSTSSPLLVNDRGQPLTVETYTSRVKKLFMDHFLPVLLRLKDYDVGNPSYQEYYDAYIKEYPGAHMFRHWFTMYLLHHIPHNPDQSIIDLVAKWRGDSTREAMLDYIHVNADGISKFQDTVLHFQRSWIKEVL